MDELKPAGIADLERLAQVTRSPDPAVVELVRAARQWHKLSDKLSSMQISYRDYARELSTKVALAAGEVHARLTPFQHIKDAE